MKPVLCILILSLLLPFCGSAQQRMHKRLFPLTGHHQLKYEYIGDLHSNRMLVRDFTGKYGYVDSAMREVVPCVYEYGQRFGNGKAAVMQNGKCGLIDTNGRMLIPCEYASMTQNHKTITRGDVWTSGVERYVIAKRDNVTVIYDIALACETVPEYEINERKCFHDKNYCVIKKGRYYGVGLENGKLKVPFEYSAIDEERDGLLRYCTNKGYGFFDTAFRKVAGPVYPDAVSFNERLAAVRKDGKWGFIDTSGVLVIEPCFERVYSFENEIAIVKCNGKYGIINKAGHINVPCVYDSITNGSESGWQIVSWIGDRRAVMLNKKWALIDSDNKLLTSFIYDGIVATEIGFKVKKDDVYRYISKDLAHTSARAYKECTSHYNNYPVLTDNGWTTLDSTLTELVPDTFKSYEDASWAVEKIRRSKIVRTVKPGEEGKYYDVSDFYNGLACVQNSVLKWGYINRRGKEVIPCKYENESVFRHGRAYVESGGVRGYINKRGRYKIKFDDETRLLHKGVFEKKSGGKAGVVNKKGKLIIPYIYDYITWVPGGKLIVNIGERNGCVNLKGDILLPVKYNEAMQYQNGVIVVPEDGQTLILDKRLKEKGKIGPSFSLRYRHLLFGFYNGLVMVADSTEDYGYMNKKGKLKIPCIFNNAERFNEGRAVVEILTRPHVEDTLDQLADDGVDGKGMINKRGKVVIPYRYDRISEYSRKRCIKVKHAHYDKYGIINKRGKLLTPHMFSDLTTYNIIPRKGWMVVKRGDKWMYIDRHGRTRLSLQRAIAL